MTKAPHNIVNAVDHELNWLNVGKRFEVGLTDIDAAIGYWDGEDK